MKSDEPPCRHASRQPAARASPRARASSALWGEIRVAPSPCGSSPRSSGLAGFGHGGVVAVQRDSARDWRALWPAVRNGLVFIQKPFLVIQLSVIQSFLDSLPIRVSFIFRTPVQSVLAKKLHGAVHSSPIPRSAPASVIASFSSGHVEAALPPSLTLPTPGRRRGWWESRAPVHDVYLPDTDIFTNCQRRQQ